MVQINFNSNTVKDDFDPIPTGDYTAMIVASKLKDTKKGGKMLVFTWKVIDGEHKNRQMWQNINLINDNEDAVRIGQQELKRIVEATGSPAEVRDSAELHNKPCTITVGISEYNGRAYNEIKGCKRSAGVPADIASAQSGHPSNVFD